MFLLHLSYVCLLRVVRCCKDALSSCSDARAALVALVPNQAHLTFTVDRPWCSCCWLKTARKACIGSPRPEGVYYWQPELLVQNECLHTSVVPGDDALLCAPSGSGAVICGWKTGYHCHTQVAWVSSFMLPGRAPHDSS